MKFNIYALGWFFAAILLAVILLSSCTPQQRLNRLQKKHPELFTADTIKVHDTTYIVAAKADTIFRQSILKDTLVINKDRLTMKYYYSNDTVFLSGACKDTTIIKEVKVITDKANITEGELPKWVWPVIICLAVFIGLLLLFKR